FPIAEDDHLLTVLRYVERNPLRAKLVRQAEDWMWSSARWWLPRRDRPGDVDGGPVARGRGWSKGINAEPPSAEQDAIRKSVERGTPLGPESWQKRTAGLMGLESTLRPRGRPKKIE